VCFTEGLSFFLCVFVALREKNTTKKRGLFSPPWLVLGIKCA